MTELDQLPEFELEKENKNAKIIVSSHQMLKKLTWFWDLFCVISYDNEIEISCDGNQLYVRTVDQKKHVNMHVTPPLGCDGKFEIRTTYRRLDRLINFLDIIEEQPITLYFDNSGWIHIIEASI